MCDTQLAIRVNNKNFVYVDIYEVNNLILTL